MKIVAMKGNSATERHLRQSIKNGLQELRGHYLDSWERSLVTVRGAKRTLTFITKDESSIRHIREVLNNYAVPHIVQ